MTTRWKLMAGVLGVSLGGLAGIAGQCPKPDQDKARRADDVLKLPEPPVIPGGGVTPPKPAPPPVEVPPPAPASLPPLPEVADAKLPPVPPPSSPKADDKKPEVAKKSEPAKKPDAAPAPLPTLPPTIVPAGGQIPAALPDAPAVPPAALPSGPVTPSAPPSAADLPIITPAAPPSPAAAPVMEFAKPAAEPTKLAVVPASASVPAAASKFRIVLRVGEGDPVFEVRHGDDLVMKVMSEKVDVKSPEKGGGLSAVTATGKVRFVGFGSEGTCDSLSFLAGTGEVALSGGVKVQVKDKIGRVESELTADQMRYKIDTTTLPGSIKP
jgi:hypothetical protein